MDQNQLMMLTMMIGNHYGMNMFYMMIAVYIVPIVYARFVRWRSTNRALTTITQMVKSGGTRINAEMYNAVSHYITILNKQPIRGEEVVDTSSGPIFTATKSGEVSFRDTQIHFNISAESDSSVIELSAPNTNILRSFVIEAVKHYETIAESRKTCDKLYKYDSERWAWSDIQLNVTKTRNNIYLDPTTDARLFDGVGMFLSKRDFYKTHGIPYKKTYLLAGLPGTGKTASVFALSQHFKMPIRKIDSSVLRFRRMLEMAFNKVKGGIVLIDEVDTIFPKRSSKEEKVKEKFDDEEYSTMGSGDLLANLLHFLDAYTYLDGCIVCMTTNYPEQIDAALKRPGRVDEIIMFDYATKEVIERILTDFCGQTCPVTVKITTARLINEIILPNLADFEKIRGLLNPVC